MIAALVSDVLFLIGGMLLGYGVAHLMKPVKPRSPLEPTDWDIDNE